MFENYKKKRIIKKFIKENKFFTTNFTQINREELKTIFDKDISLEEFLNYLIKKYDFYLHGSRNDFKENYIISKNNKIYITDNPSIAILKSIFSNINSILKYPYLISKTNPLVLRIQQYNSNTIGEKGYIYLSFKEKDFKNYPKGSWQYLNTKKNKIQIFGKIEVRKDDFKYPVKKIN